MASSYEDAGHAFSYIPQGGAISKEGEATMRMKGSQIVMECLLEQGVDTVFGYPGGTILNIYDEFELHGYKEKIHHYLTSHEQGASHAADGYARSTGKVGVCFATSGPGATNLVTGIATAYYDSSPVVLITCWPMLSGRPLPSPAPDGPARCSLILPRMSLPQRRTMSTCPCPSTPTGAAWPTCCAGQAGT